MIFATSLSDLFLEEAIKIFNRENCVVIAADPAVNQKLKEVGLPSQFVSSAVPESWGERDTSFAELAMPGVFGEHKFLNSDLELHQVLSIDRLSFWYGGKNSKRTIDTISLLDPRTLYTDLNIHSPYPWALANRSERTVAYQTRPIRNIETYNAAQYFSFDEIVVYTQGEKELLAQAGFQGKITARKEDTWKTIESQPSPGLKSGLGAEGELVIGIVFDKRLEWDARNFIKKALESWGSLPYLIFFPVDERGKELLPRCLRPYRSIINITDKSVLKACDRIYAFGWDDYLAEYNFNLEIIDWCGKNRAEILAPKGVKVHEALPSN